MNDPNVWREILIGAGGSICLLLGFAGCVLPFLPGPPVAYLAVFAKALSDGFDPPLGPVTVSVLGILAFGMALADNVIPLVSARRWGSSAWGMWGCAIGMILGILLFPPFGIVPGGLAGAAVGEALKGKTGHDVLRATVGTLVGMIVGAAGKLVVCAILAVYFIVSFF